MSNSPVLWVIEIQSDEGEWLPWDDGCFMTREHAREQLSAWRSRQILVARIRKYVRQEP